MAAIGIASVISAFGLLPEQMGESFFFAVRGVTAVSAGIAMVVWSRRAQGRLRRARALIGAGLLIGCLNGAVLIGFINVTGSLPPAPSIADGLYFGAYLASIIGLLSYPTSETRAGSVPRSLLDGFIAASGLWFCVYSLALEPAHVGEGMSLAARLTIFTYPALAVFVLGMITSVIPRASDAARRELTILCAGLALMSIFEVAATVQLAQNDQIRFASWAGALGELGLGLILFAAISRKRELKNTNRFMKWLPTLPFLPVLAAVAVALLLLAQGQTLSPAQNIVGIMIIAGLMLRQSVAGRDRAGLLGILTRREQLFSSLVTDSSDLITLQDQRGVMKYVSPAMARFTGLPEDVLVRRCFDDFIHPLDRRRVFASLTGVRAKPGASTEVVCRMQTGEGEWRWTQTLLHNRLDDPSVAGVVCNTRDIHRRHLLEQRLSHAAYHDALTGLGNLAHAHSLIESRCYGEGVAAGSVILIDLDGFKAINDTFGHPFGDEILKVLGRRLARAVPDGDSVSRIGGDEFVVVIDDEDLSTSIAEGIMGIYREPVRVGEISVPVAASVGVALARDAADEYELLRNADLAMYTAKAHGRNRVFWYEPYMHEQTAHRMGITRGLRQALDEGNLSVEYQRIVRLEDGETIACEALARWDDPIRGRVAPAEFIPVAEESGLIIEIGDWVLSRVSSDIAAWRAAGVLVPTMSVNVSRRQLGADFPDKISAALARAGLKGPEMCIEITESAVLNDVSEAVAVLRHIRALGVSVALDDFGTGQSSVSQLRTLPVDIVKIDQSFARPADRVASRDTLLKSIVALCASLSLSTVVEGIEDEDTAREAMAAGCDFGQGFWFGRPQPAPDFVRTLASRLPAQGSADAEAGISDRLEVN